MFKKSRRKIVAAIMSVLVLLWVGSLGVIYTSSYIEMSKRNETMMTRHAEMYTISNPFGEMPQMLPMPEGNGNMFDPGFAESPMFQLSTFYTVAMSYNGDVLEIRNSQPNVHSDDDLKELAEKIVDGNKSKGTDNNLTFYKADKSGYTLVVFMDNTVINENAATLFRYTLIFGGMALVVFYFLSVYLARKIVHPLEESYKKQKQFISDAGHELKTPVSVVNANAELLSREIGENQWLQNILYENERMGMLVGQLLELARAESVKGQLNGTIGSTSATQKEETLVDASHINTSDMGSMGGKGGFGGDMQKPQNNSDNSTDSDSAEKPSTDSGTEDNTNSNLRPQMPDNFGSMMPEFGNGENGQMQGANGNFPSRGESQAQPQSMISASSLVMIGVSVLVLALGIVIALKFRRRR